MSFILDVLKTGFDALRYMADTVLVHPGAAAIGFVVGWVYGEGVVAAATVVVAKAWSALRWVLAKIKGMF
jgi:lipid-binding SYLF domain-containing protein